MNNKFKYTVFLLSAVALLSSCKDVNEEKYYGNGGADGTSVSLQASSPVTIGMETDYAPLNAANYLQTVVANASQTTFGSAMTHGAIVQADSTLDFSMPDAQMAAVNAKGLKVWGHALCWYKNQNANFIKTFAGLLPPPNALAEGNPDFEDWVDNQTVAGWSWANGKDSYGTVLQGTKADDVNHGKSSMTVTIIQTVASIGSSWHLQLVSPSFISVAGHEYSVSFYAKASVSDCQWQGEWDHNGSPSYTSGDLTTSWTNYAMKFSGANPKGTGVPTTICFDLAYSPVGAVIYLDNVVIVDETQAALDSDPETQATLLNETFQNWVTGIVSHYKGQVVGWDVVNELFADDGSIRNNANTTSSSATDWFVWSNYLGKNIGVTAFNLAHEADPNALLFINESGLECNTATSSQKLDSLIAYVQWLKSQGVHIDGIGTSMHVNIATAKVGVDYMFRKLAATGLKIRISELDVSVNQFIGTTKSNGFVLTPEVLADQAVTYHDVIASYLQNVPAEQRQDITIWGVNDPNSWLYNNGQNYPLLFDANYVTKPAFDGFLQGLKAQ